jgi:hypothetical protein
MMGEHKMEPNHNRDTDQWTWLHYVRGWLDA